MADKAVAEAVKRKKAEEALLNGDFTEEDLVSEEEQDQPDETVSTRTNGSSRIQSFDDYGAPPSKQTTGGFNQPGSFLGEEGVEVPPEPAAPSSRFIGSEQGMDVGPTGPASKVYTGPEEEGGQRYVIDPESGQKVPYAELATEADKAAQPPGGVPLQKVTVTGEPEVRRAELLDPDPDRQYLIDAGILPPPQVRRAYPPGATPKAEPLEAPAKLDQVERGELVKLPPEAPADLAQVERGQLVKVPPGTAPRAPLIPTPPAVKPAELVIKPAPAAVEERAPKITTNPDGTDFPQYVSAVGNNDPAAFIVHHTSGRGTVDGVVSTLKERGLGVQYVMDRDGNIFQTGGPGAQNIRTGWGKGEGLSNRNVVGMEIIAKDDKDVTPAQAQSFARFIAARYPNTPLFGHGEVNPGHKEADEGQTAKAAALAYRESGGEAVAREPGAPKKPSKIADFSDYAEAAQAPAQGQPALTKRARPAGQNEQGFYQDEKPEDFVYGSVTTFGDEEDRRRYAQAKAAGLSDAQARQIGDDGHGAPNLGGLYTPDTYGMAIPREALIAELGNNTAAWRKARIDIINLATGQRLRVPAVDIGPGPGPQSQGVAADFTPLLARQLGTNGKFAFKIVPDAGPDVNKHPDLWQSEQSAIAQGIDSSTLEKGRQIFQRGGSKPMTDAEVADVEKRKAQLISQQRDIITKLPETGSGNVIGLYKRLGDDIEGVSTGMRQRMRTELKPQIIAAMREKYPEIKTDDEAWTKAQSDIGPLEIGQEFGSKIMGYIQQVESVTRKAGAGTDQFAVDRFLGAVLPKGSEADKHELLSKLYAMPPDQRATEIEARLGPGFVEPGNPNKDPLFLAQAITRLADPKFQQRKADELTKLKAEMRHNLSDDPRLKGTRAEEVVDNAAQLITTIPQFATPAMWPLALAQINDQMREAAKAEHPEWDEKTLTDNATRATLTMFFGQLGANKLIMMGIGPLLGGAVSPTKRIIAQALAAAGGGPAIAAGTKVGTNIATGEPIGKGVGEAAESGLIQGVLGGIPHVGGEIIAGRRGAPVTERPPVTEERPPVTEGPPPVAPVEPPAVPVTKEDVHRRAYELYDERTKNGQPGTALDDWVQAQKELSQAKEPPPPTQGEAEPWVSAIANRFAAERVARGEIGDIIPGEGYSKEELLARGLQMGPEQINQHVSDLMNNRGGDPKLQAGAVRAEEARLSQRSNAASRALEANPADKQLRLDADNAFKDLTDFHNGPVAKLKNNWHAQGMTLQGEVPVDLTTFNGMREKFLRDVGKPPPANMEPVLRKVAQNVHDSVAADNQALRNLGAEIERQTVRAKLPTAEEVRARIMERMKVDPCIS